MNPHSHPPGHPGATPHWTSGRKSGVGTAIGAESDVWFTLSHGIVNEIYYPQLDCANTRDCEFIVIGPSFFSEEKRDTDHRLRLIEPGVPGYRLTNTCKQGRYRIRKTVITDPRNNSVMMDVAFEPLQGRLEDHRLYMLLAPHIENRGADNEGWVGDYLGQPMLFARRGGTVMGAVASAPWTERTCGYVGMSDGWQQLRRHGWLDPSHDRAGPGNIALTGGIDLMACDGRFTLVIAFGRSHAECGRTARASLIRGFEPARDEYVSGWRDYQRGCRAFDSSAGAREFADLYRMSTTVLRVHESKRFHGGIIASLSIPWGPSRGDDDLGGYHYVWPRDQWHAAVALLAIGQHESARQTLLSLMCTQQVNGAWPQNMWIDGHPHQLGVQNDEPAGFLLLADMLRRAGALGTLEPWPSMRRAAEFLLENGPVTDHDRWETNSGYTPYTLALTISGLLAAADFADSLGDSSLADNYRTQADEWNANIERWLYVTDTPLSRSVGVEGYYVWLAPGKVKRPEDLHEVEIWLPNHPPGGGRMAAWEVASVDALALVRYGLRRADDPRIQNTVRVIDAALKRETARGPAWRRFTRDGYGEDEEGNAFNGTGIGRCWPLLTGERAHYELLLGNTEEAHRLMEVMASQTGEGWLFPEQIWDAPDLPGRSLLSGRPTGSAMPLVWAHAEFLTLMRSLHDGAVFDRPPQAVQRYLTDVEASVER